MSRYTFIMQNEKMLASLKPLVAEKAREFIRVAKEEGIEILITSGFRSIEDQNKLYEQGRSTKGSIVTNAKGGQSFHNYGCAFDVVPIVNGKLDWNYPFSKLGAIGEACGLEWGGRWPKFKDEPHFQFTAGYSLEDFQKKFIDENKFGAASPVLDLKRTLVYGETSNDVFLLQQFLKKHGFLSTSVLTNFYGVKTKEAVLAFQKRYVLSPLEAPFNDGKNVGPRTRLAIRNFEAV